MIEVRTAKTAKELKVFRKLPESIYRDDPAWVPPISFEAASQLDRRKNPWFEHGDAEFFVAYRNGVPVGRVSAQVDRLHNERYEERTGFFGFFDCIHDADVAQALLARAEEWLVDRGMERVRGPFSLGINGISGCLVDGFETPPYLEMAHGRTWYPALIEGCGFVKAKDLFAWAYTAREEPPEPVKQIAAYCESQPGLVVRELRMDHFEEDLDIILSIFNEAWSQNWGFVPITPAEVRKMAKDLKLIIEPRLGFIAEVNGEPAAISLTIPNLNHLLHRYRSLPEPLRLARAMWDLKVTKQVGQARLMILGIRRKFRGSSLGGLSVLLYCRTHAVGKALGYLDAELSWTLEDNERINQGIEMMGGKKYKTYRVYEKELPRLQPPPGRPAPGSDAAP